MDDDPIFNVVFNYNKSEDFKKSIENFKVITNSIFHRNFGYKIVCIERLSFIDYKNESILPNFPVNQSLRIWNTDTLQRFGMGKFNGFFFDVIARVDLSNKPHNFRIFYDYEEEQQEPSNEEYIFLLGETRKIIKKGRFKYIDYNGKLISVTQAKKGTLGSLTNPPLHSTRREPHAL